MSEANERMPPAAERLNDQLGKEPLELSQEAAITCNNLIAARAEAAKAKAQIDIKASEEKK